MWFAIKSLVHSVSQSTPSTFTSTPGAILSLAFSLVSAFLLHLFFQSTPVLAAAPQEPNEEIRAALKKTISEAESFQDRFEAEVWLVDMSSRMKRYVKDPNQRLHILKTVHKEAKRHQLNPQLVLAVIHVESLFDQFAISSAGAQGLMQVMPFWRKELGDGTANLTVIETNISYGCTILKTYLNVEKGHVARALARYNGSVGKTWYPERVFNAWQKYWKVKS